MKLSEMQLFSEMSTEKTRRLMQGIIDFTDGIDSLSALDLVSALETIESDFLPDIEVVRVRLFASPGGAVVAALSMYDSIRSFAKKHNIPVQVEVYGCAYSAACMIVLQAGDVRLSTPNCTFLLHEPRQFTLDTETGSDVEDKREGFLRITNQVYTVMAQRTGKTVEEVQEAVCRREVWLDVKEAMEWGLLDGIL